MSITNGASGKSFAYVLRMTGDTSPDDCHIDYELIENRFVNGLCECSRIVDSYTMQVDSELVDVDHFEQATIESMFKIAMMNASKRMAFRPSSTLSFCCSECCLIQF